MKHNQAFDKECEDPLSNERFHSRKYYYINEEWEDYDSRWSAGKIIVCRTKKDALGELDNIYKTELEKDKEHSHLELVKFYKDDERFGTRVWVDNGASAKSYVLKEIDIEVSAARIGVEEIGLPENLDPIYDVKSLIAKEDVISDIEQMKKKETSKEAQKAYDNVINMLNNLL